MFKITVFFPKFKYNDTPNTIIKREYTVVYTIDACNEKFSEGGGCNLNRSQEAFTSHYRFLFVFLVGVCAPYLGADDYDDDDVDYYYY